MQIKFLPVFSRAVKFVYLSPDIKRHEMESCKNNYFQPLNLPSFPYRLSQQGGKNLIFDVLRKKYVALTPEEWVRQHFTNYLLRIKGYPSGLLANEVQICLNGTKKRCDTVLFGKDRQARMIVEYKASTVEITQAVFNQITRYNMVLHVDYLIVTNGISHFCCQIDYAANSYRFLPDIPAYVDLE